MEELTRKVDTYLNRVIRLQSEGVYYVDISQGYYKSDDEVLSSLEKEFLEKVPVNLSQLEEVLYVTRSSSRRSHILHLLGWAPDHVRVHEILKDFLRAQEPAVVNAAARSLFPMAYTGKTTVDFEMTWSLLSRRSMYIRNKALGLILVMPEGVAHIQKDAKKRKRIAQLARSRVPIVREPAHMLLERIGEENTR